MKNLIIIITLLIFTTACKSTLTIVESTEQEIISGKASTENYSRYVFEIKNNSKNEIQIKDVLIKKGEKFYSIKFDIMDISETSTKQSVGAMETVHIVGNYKNNSAGKPLTTEYTGAAVIIYSYGGNEKSLVISEITIKEPERKRGR